MAFGVSHGVNDAQVGVEDRPARWDRPALVFRMFFIYMYTSSRTVDSFYKQLSRS